jgi:hypothetical protein
MQELNEKQRSGKVFKMANFSLNEQRNFVGFFVLLLKVDKRVNPAFYQRKNTQKYD